MNCFSVSSEDICIFASTLFPGLNSLLIAMDNVTLMRYLNYYFK